MTQRSFGEALELVRDVSLVARVNFDLRRVGAELKGEGDDLGTFCPFCVFTPSPVCDLMVSPTHQVWFTTACAKGGDLIHWVQATSGVEFPVAVQAIEEMHDLGSERGW